MTNKKINPLDKTTVNVYLEWNRKLGEVVGSIDDRVNYIIETICGAFGLKIEWWSYSHSDDSGGDFTDAYGNTDVSPNICIKSDWQPCVVLLNDGSEWGLLDSFPTRWLFEDFEGELISGQAKFMKQEEDKKNKARGKREAKKEKEKELLEQIKSKLSPEELKVLKLKKK